MGDESKTKDQLIAELIKLRKQVGQLKILEESRMDFNEDINHIVRHDLKAPLSGIIAMAESLGEDSNLNDEQVRILRMLRKTGRRMLSLIDATLLFNQVEQSAFQLKTVCLDMVPLIRRIFDEQETILKSKRLEKKLCLNGEPAQPVDRFMVLGDEVLCYSMMSNLIRNACEASPYGERVQVRLFEKDRKAKDKKVIEIHNKGTVPQEIRERFFEKYVTSGKNHGTGLGAYSAKVITEKLGGHILMNTCENNGTVISVHLPPCI